MVQGWLFLGFATILEWQLIILSLDIVHTSSVETCFVVWAFEDLLILWFDPAKPFIKGAPPIGPPLGLLHAK